MISKIINYQLSIFNFKISGKDLVKHPLFSGSAVMILGTNFANFLAYIYHLIIGRLLGPSAYGELAASLSALGMLSVAFTFLGLVVVKFVSAADDKEKKRLFNWFGKLSLILGIVAMILLLILSPFLADFLHLSSAITILFGPAMFFFVLGFLYKSFLQGLLRFKENVMTINAEVVFRLLFGVILILAGFSAFGGVFGIFLGALGSFLLGKYYLREYQATKVDGKFDDGKRIIKYVIPVFVISVTVNSFFSSDLLLVKHYFSAYEAGLYAALSTLGKIIYFGAGPVTAVMFPLISQRYSKGQGYKKILMMSFILTLGIAGAVLVIYWFFPQLSVRLLYGEEFLSAAVNLIWFGLFMLVFTIANLIISFYLSIEKTQIAIVPPVFALAQIIGIIYFHQSLLEVIKVSFLAASFLLAFLLIYLSYDIAKRKS